MNQSKIGINQVQKFQMDKNERNDGRIKMNPVIINNEYLWPH